MNERVPVGISKATKPVQDCIALGVKSVKGAMWLLSPEYPKWKHHIPETPTIEEVREAWRRITRWEIMVDQGTLEVIWNDDKWDIKFISDKQIMCNWELYTLDGEVSEGCIGAYYSAWYYPEQCTITWTHCDTRNQWFTIQLPNGITLNHGWFGEHTETPDTNKSFFFSGYWPSWEVDNNEHRFYLIDKETGLPHNWENVKAVQTLKNYISNVVHWDVAQLMRG